ncbi:S9 family peptidase [Sorangium sp. So ce233]|uniref:S9 family peptidase n=1 Tax=Sorangium sp. So ce233 TaxID=3133290 RepID=UPI003F5D644B
MRQRHARRFEPDDLLSFKLVSEMVLSPDGRWVAYVLEEIDPEADTYVSNLWLIPAGGGEPRQITFGSDTNESPRFSPDASRIAFLSDRGGGAAQLHVIRVDGGEARRLTDLESGAGLPAWSPDGSALVFSAPVASGAPPGAPRVVTRALYKSDGEGFVLDRPTHLFIISAEGGEARQITQGDANESNPAWSPDGRLIAFSRTRTGPRDAHRSDLWVIEPSGGGLRQVTRSCPLATMPSWSPDSRTIAFYSPREDGGSRRHVWIVGAGGEADPRMITSEDTEVAEFPLGKMMPPAWSADGRELAVVLATESTSEVALVSVEERTIRKAISDDRQITQISAAPGAGTIAFLWSTMRLCGLLGSARWDGSGSQLLINVNAEWGEDRAWPEVSLREFRGASGMKNVGLLMLPPGHEGGPVPLLVNVHGGPHAYVEFGFTYRPYWYVLVSRGWAVLSLNPVGSGGYGKEFADRLRGRWGERDLPEHLAAIDELVAEGTVDADRVAIAGKSYGGFMAAWAIGKTKRFRAAVSSAPVANLESHFGTSDTGYYVDPHDMRAEPFDKRERYRKLSPVTWAGEATTPTLILCGEEDHRCPIGQSEELFAALVRSGKAPVEFIRFPGGDHHLAENGKPSHRVFYNRRLVAWVEAHCAKERAPERA